MNEPLPLTPEAVDALLSAELDGDLEAAARDLGLDASGVRTQLDATPGVEARRAVLAQARDLLASRPLLESSDVDRLVAAAMAGNELTAVRARRARSQRQWRVLVATGSVAAAIAVIVGVASMNTHSSQSKSRDAAAAAAPTARDNHAESGTSNAPPRATDSNVQPDLGDVSTAAQLHAPAKQLLRLAERKATSPVAVPQGTSTPATTQPGRYGAADSANGFNRAAPACTTRRLRSYDITGTPALIARGTVDGAPVAILIYDREDVGAFAYVIRVRDCTLLRKQPLG